MSRQINIVQVLYSGLGGHGSVAFSLEDAKSKPINFSYLFYGIEPLRKEYEVKCKESGLNFRSIKKKRGADFHSIKKYYQWLKNNNFDIILLHSVLLLVPTYFYCLFHKKKLVLVEHQTNFHKTKIEWVWTLLSQFLAHKIVYLTPDYKQQVLEKIGFIKDQKIFIVPNGLPQLFFNETLPKQKRPLIFSMQSRFTPLRDHYTLLKAYKKFLNNNLINSSIMYLAGDGETRKKIEKNIKELELEDNVKLLGMLNEADLIDLLKKTDIYIHSSLGETMSTAIMQAMATNKPIIATNISGINNVIEDGDNGYLFTPGDDIKLSELMDKLANDVGLRMILGKKAGIYAKKKFTLQCMIRGYEKVFKSLIIN